MAGSGYTVVPVQKAFTALRIIQVIIGVAILGLSCYPVSLTSGYGSAYIFEVSLPPTHRSSSPTSLTITQPGALAIFTAIATGIFVAYWFIAHSATNQKKLYNYLALFAVEFFVWVFWLTTFALYASFVSASLATMGDYDTTSYGTGSNTYCYAGYCVSARGLRKRYVESDPVLATIYSALALSVVDL
jgi:hypothetical protein